MTHLLRPPTAYGFYRIVHIFCRVHGGRKPSCFRCEQSRPEGECVMTNKHDKQVNVLRSKWTEEDITVHGQCQASRAKRQIPGNDESLEIIQQRIRI